MKRDDVIPGDYGEVVVMDWGLAEKTGTYDPEQTVDPSEADQSAPTRSGR